MTLDRRGGAFALAALAPPAAALVVTLAGLGACRGVDDPDGGPNAPCTRSSHCTHDLVCFEGVCRDRDELDGGGGADAGATAGEDGPAAETDGGEPD